MCYKIYAAFRFWLSTFHFLLYAGLKVSWIPSYAVVVWFQNTPATGYVFLFWTSSSKKRILHKSSMQPLDFKTQGLQKTSKMTNSKGMRGAVRNGSTTRSCLSLRGAPRGISSTPSSRVAPSRAFESKLYIFQRQLHARHVSVPWIANQGFKIMRFFDHVCSEPE
jgi:hypothetical protein